MGTELYNSISDYYDDIDNTNINSIEIFSIDGSVRKKFINLNEIDRQNILTELYCLNFDIRNGEIHPQYEGTNKEGLTVIYPDINTIDENKIEYLKNRLETVKNIYLRTHFLHIIWYKTKDYEYGKKAIDSYFLLIENFRKLDINAPTEYYGMDICNALNNLQYLVFYLQHKTDDFKNLILDILANPNKNSSGYLKLQVECIKMLVEKVKKNKLNKSVLNGLEDLCKNSLQIDGLNEYFIADFLKLGEEISKIMKTEPDKWILEQATHYENLSNTKNSMIAPEYCQKAINLYKQLKNEKKVSELHKKYSFLSQAVNLTPYTCEEKDLTSGINGYIKIAENFSSEEILKFIVYSSSIIPDYEELKLFEEENKHKYFLSSLFSNTNIIDAYGHVIDKLRTDEEKTSYQIYRDYDYMLQIQSHLLYHFLKKLLN